MTGAESGLSGQMWFIVAVGMVAVLGALLSYDIARSKRRPGAEQAVAPELRDKTRQHTKKRCLASARLKLDQGEEQETSGHVAG